MKLASTYMPGPFCWRVPTDGFSWVEAEEIGTRRRGCYLVPKEFVRNAPPLTLSEPTPAARSYQPMADGVLFLRFAELEPTETGVLQFANGYGALSESSEGPGNIVVLDNQTQVLASSLALWTQKIWELRRAVELWRKLGYGDSPHPGEPDMDFLRQRVQLELDRDRRVFALYKNEPRDPRKAFPLYDPTELIFDTRPESLYHHELAWHTRPGDVLRPARFFLGGLVTEELRTHTSLELSLREKGRELRLHSTPKNLLGALWLQLARAIDGDRGYRRCQQCGASFEVSLEASRRSREYCEDRCKFKAYRERRAQAVKLRAEGRPLGVIAKALGSRVDVVKRWIAKRPSGVRMTSRSVKVAKGLRRRPARRRGPN